MSKSKLSRRPRSTRSQLMPELKQSMDDHGNDWKLGPNIQLKVVMKKSDLLNAKHFQTIPAKNADVKSKSMPRIQKCPVRRLTPNTKNFVEELRELLPRCDLNCQNCEQYILQLTQHIQVTHDPQEDGQRFFNSLTSCGQEPETGSKSDFDLGIDPSPALSHDSESQSRTLNIPDANFVNEVDKLDKTVLGQLPVTSEGQVASTWAIPRNYVDESDDVEITDVAEVEVEFISDTVQNFEKLPEPNENPESDPAVLTSTSIGDQVDLKVDSDPDYVKKDDTDSESEENEGEEFEKSEGNFDTVKNFKEIRTGKDIPYDCEYCGKRFKNKNNAWDHLNAHKGKTHMCEFCGKILKRKFSLEKHRLRRHTGETMRGENKIHDCETCGKSCVSLGRLNEHKKSHISEKPFICEICGACFKWSNSLKGHKVIHEEKQHICGHCGQAFSKGSTLKRHSEIHTRKNPYKCKITNCEESFLLKKQFELHQKIHSGVKVYKCDCGKYFRVMKQLTRHQKCHKDERKFKCSVCPKSFKLKNHLNTHFKIHIGIKAHKCDECGRTFTLPSELRSHQKRISKCTPQARVCDTESVLTILE